MGSEIRNPNHLKSGQMAAILSKTKRNPDLEMSGFRMVGTIAIAIAKARSFGNYKVNFDHHFLVTMTMTLTDIPNVQKLLKPNWNKFPLFLILAQSKLAL